MKPNPVPAHLGRALSLLAPLWLCATAAAMQQTPAQPSDTTGLERVTASTERRIESDPARGTEVVPSPPSSSAGSGPPPSLPDVEGMPVEPFSLYLAEADIRDVLHMLGRHFRLNIVMTPEVQGNVSVYFTGVDPQQALRSIVGANGGAVRMNAGCYGSYVADHFVEAQAVTRAGDVVTLTADDLKFRYRQTDLPEGWVLTRATFEGVAGDPEELAQRMDEQLAKRDATQPTKDRTAGSTFRNPAGFSSTGQADDVHDLKAWKLIDDAGMRGARVGGAQMSEKHSNFLINTGDATAEDLESLGEEVRKRVFQSSGIELHWEIMRVGEKS